MRVGKKQIVTGGFLMTSVVAANFLNFLFNALLGRWLNYTDFGVVTLLVTFYSIWAILTNGLAATINYSVSKLSANGSNNDSTGFLTRTIQSSFIYIVMAAILWLIFIPQTMAYFHVDTSLPFISFVPVIIFSSLAYPMIGYLQGKLEFMFAGIVILSESIVKLLIGLVLTVFGLGTYSYLTIPISLLICALIGFSIIRLKFTKKIESKSKPFNFPKQFFGTMVGVGIGSTLFFGIDLLLVKHFFTPTLSGQYALVSLIGKMVYFFSILLNMFTLPLVARSKIRSKKLFYMLVGGTLALATVAWLTLGLFSSYSIPFLFGAKTNPILYLLPIYTLGISIYSVANVIVSYHIARLEYIFSLPLIIAGIVVGTLIFFHHSNLQVITTNITITSFCLLAELVGMHIYYVRRHIQNG